MNKYYSLSPNNKKQFHDFLSPIFDAVRKNRIYSYYQLENKETNNQNQKMILKKHNIFQPKPKTAHDLQANKQTDLLGNRKRLTYNGLYSPEGQIEKKNQTSNSSKLSNSKDLIENKDSKVPDPPVDMSNKTTQYTMFRVSSKVKKHLIQQIDFQQIQKMFFKKRQTMTRYEYFLKVKNQSKNSQSKKNMKSSLSGRKRSKQKNNNGLLTKDQQIALFTGMSSQYQREMSPFSVRSPQKRKFWIKQSNRPSKERCFPGTMIQGTPYKTIQN